MMIHVLIQTERRVSTKAAPRQLSLPIQGQLHSMGASIADLTAAQILYATTWDGTSPWVTVLKGNIADLKMAYLGWPMVDQAAWQKNNPVVLP